VSGRWNLFNEDVRHLTYFFSFASNKNLSNEKHTSFQNFLLCKYYNEMLAFQNLEDQIRQRVSSLSLLSPKPNDTFAVALDDNRTREDLLLPFLNPPLQGNVKGGSDHHNMKMSLGSKDFRRERPRFNFPEIQTPRAINMKKRMLLQNETQKSHRLSSISPKSTLHHLHFDERLHALVKRRKVTLPLLPRGDALIVSNYREQDSDSNNNYKENMGNCEDEERVQVMTLQGSSLPVHEYKHGSLFRAEQGKEPQFHIGTKAKDDIPLPTFLPRPRLSKRRQFVTKLAMRHSTLSFLSSDNGNNKSNSLSSYDRRSEDICNNFMRIAPRDKYIDKQQDPFDVVRSMLK